MHWRNRAKLETPPADWHIDTPPTLTVRMRFANRVNQLFMRQVNGYIYNDWPNGTPSSQTVEVESVINPAIPLAQNTVTFAVVGQPGKFISRAGDSWGRVDIYSGDSKGHFSLDRRADGYYSIKNVDDNEYMYMYSNEKTYINRDGNAENKDSQWRVQGLPEPYLVGGHYVFQFATSSSRITYGGGKLTVASNGGFAPGSVLLERQADGSYFVRMAGDPSAPYVRLSSDRSLVIDARTGSKFFIRELQQGGSFTLQTEDGRYWWADPKLFGSGFTTVEGLECGLDRCAPPILGDGIANRARRPGSPGSDECTPEEQRECQAPQLFKLTRDWKRDDR